MSITNIPLNKLLRLFCASSKIRRKILLHDIRNDQSKALNKRSTGGGDFYGPFWADAKAHVAGLTDLTEQTAIRIESNKRRERLYQLLRDGFLDLYTRGLRWSNEPITLFPENIHGKIDFTELNAVVRLENVLFVQIRERYTRIAYPFFSDDPMLSDEGARLGFWAMSEALKAYELDDMRILDIIQSKPFSPRNHSLVGDERDIFVSSYAEIISEWNTLRED